MQKFVPGSTFTAEKASFNSLPVELQAHLFTYLPNKRKYRRVSHLWNAAIQSVRDAYEIRGKMGCDSILKMLEQTPKLKKLNIHGFPESLKEEDMIAILEHRQCQKLEHLGLFHDHYITAAILKKIAALPQLKSLEFTGSPLILDKESGIFQLQNLEHLSLARTHFKEGSFQQLLSMPKLSSLTLDLNLYGDGLTLEQTLFKLAQIKSLARLTVQNCESFPQKGMEALANIPSLTHLKVEGVNRFPSSNWKVIPSLPALSHLSIPFIENTDSSYLQLLLEAAQLKFISLGTVPKGAIPPPLVEAFKKREIELHYIEKEKMNMDSFINQLALLNLGIRSWQG